MQHTREVGINKSENKMSKEIIEKAILATQFKINRLKSETDFFTRNKWKTIGFGALVTILGPFYNSDPDLAGNSRSALEVSETNYQTLSIAIAIFYSVSVIIAHFVWKKHDSRKNYKLK